MYFFLTEKGGVKEKVNIKHFGVFMCGINLYLANNKWNLGGACNDVNNFRNMLSTYQLPSRNFTYLIDKEATKVNIIRSLNKLVSDYRHGIFFYSGHGSYIYDPLEKDNRAEVLITTDHKWNDPLVDNEIRAILSRMESCWLFADCCYAEGFSKDANVIIKSISPVGIMNFPVSKYIIEVDKENMYEFAGCRSYEYSIEGYIDNIRQGFFTYHNCNIIRENPIITLVRWQNEIRKRISSQNPIVNPCIDIPIFRS